jgi:hypothetical protein
MESIDKIEDLYQEVKKEYLLAHINKKDKGLGSVNNPETIQFLKKHLSKELKKSINKEMKIISNYVNNNKCIEENYEIIRELYYVHPSFHENWFINGHFDKYTSIVCGRIGLKSYITSIRNGTLTTSRIKMIASYVFKQVIMLENQFSGVSDKSLFDYEAPDDLIPVINYLQTRSSPEDIQDMKSMLVDIYRAMRWLLNETNYRNLVTNTSIGWDSWFHYAPCTVNEGPIFHKTSSESRLEIFSKITKLDEETIRNELRKYYDIEEIYMV